MIIKRILILALITCCAACGMVERDGQHSFQLPVAESGTAAKPRIFDINNRQMLDELSAQLGGKRAIFVGEVHDSLAHHQNQLRIIQSLYGRYPDLAIGVEYFQQPFQPYLDDYIAGRINEREMLIKTEYFKRWQVDFRLLRPIFEFAREKHIPLLALNIADEIHNKVFRNGMSSLTAQERSQTPDVMEPASEHYRQRLKAIFDSHPEGNYFENFVAGVLLWDSSMADTAARYLNTHPQSRMVVLAGMVHIMYGDGIPERLDHRLGSKQSALLLNGSDFSNYPGSADYLLLPEDHKELPQTGKLGVAILENKDSVYVNDFTSGSGAQVAGLRRGDHIVALNGVKVVNMIELRAIMFDKQAGERVQVEVLRNDATDDSKQALKFDVELR
ncbi:MAG: ChaN family lipoprotein [Gallionella sp.]